MIIPQFRVYFEPSVKDHGTLTCINRKSENYGHSRTVDYDGQNMIMWTDWKFPMEESVAEDLLMFSSSDSFMIHVRNYRQRRIDPDKYMTDGKKPILNEIFQDYRDCWIGMSEFNVALSKLQKDIDDEKATNKRLSLYIEKLEKTPKTANLKLIRKYNKLEKKFNKLTEKRKSNLQKKKEFENIWAD
jgi:hypothetical protein